MDLSGIITGDIVASTKLSAKSRDRLFIDLKKFLGTLKTNGWLTAFEVFRGDSLQCVVKNKEQVLRTALMIRSFMKSYNGVAQSRQKKIKAQKSRGIKGYFPGRQDVRLAIGVGKVDFLKTRLAQSDGEAFHLSGQGLDMLKDSARRMKVQTANDQFNDMMEAPVLLLDAVIEKWTSNQAEIILYKLQNYKEEQIALLIGISQPAVNQRTKTSQWNAIEKLLSWFEKTIKDWQS